VAPTRSVASRSEHRDDGGARRRFRTWVSRRNTVLTVAAASIAPILYFIFVYHYGVNSFNSDDWTVTPIVNAALHGQPILGLLWAQHHESRLFIGNIVDVLFGYADRLDLRSIMMFSAFLLIASYGALLILVRKYTGRPLTPIPVLVLGVTWFSLADVQNALWAFQVSWYSAVFFFFLMLCLLLVPNGRRTLWFALAIVVAIAGSLSTIQGFLCWPLGAICILWPTPSSRWRRELVTWVGAMVAIMAVYLVGFSVGAGNTCRVQAQCTPSAELHHPLTSFGFFFALIGNVIPGGTTGIIPTVGDGARFVVLGLVIFAVALFVLIQSWRHRTTTERLPLPALIIAFSLLFDVTITTGRGGSGVAGAVNANRFVMANLILLTGIVVYGLARVPALPLPVTSGRSQSYGRYVALLGLAVFLVVQVTAATEFGFTNARTSSRLSAVEAQGWVSFVASHPSLYKGLSFSCRAQAGFLLAVPETMVHDAVADQLGEFHAASDGHYVTLPTPEPDPACGGKPLFP
jgi:hypothetical protein